jgi:hypothetical protein
MIWYRNDTVTESLRKQKQKTETAQKQASKHATHKKKPCFLPFLLSSSTITKVTVTNNYLSTSYRKSHTLPPSCPDYYTDLFGATLHEVLPKPPRDGVRRNPRLDDMVSQ